MRGPKIFSDLGELMVIAHTRYLFLFKQAVLERQAAMRLVVSH